MISLDKENNITISHGDTLPIEFIIDEPLAAGDVAVFSIKRSGRTLFSSEFSGEGSTSLTFVVPKTDMAKLNIGKYVYDLHFIFSSGIRYTADFVRRLEIVQVAHEV